MTEGIVKSFVVDYCTCPECVVKGSSVTIIVKHDGIPHEVLGPFFADPSKGGKWMQAARALMERGFAESTQGGLVLLYMQHEMSFIDGHNADGTPYPRHVHRTD